MQMEEETEKNGLKRRMLRIEQSGEMECKQLQKECGESGHLC